MLCSWFNIHKFMLANMLTTVSCHFLGSLLKSETLKGMVTQKHGPGKLDYSAAYLAS